MYVEDIAKIQTTQNTELRQKINELEQQNAELVADNKALHLALEKLAKQTAKNKLNNL